MRSEAPLSEAARSQQAAGGVLTEVWRGALRDHGSTCEGANKDSFDAVLGSDLCLHIHALIVVCINTRMTTAAAHSAPRRVYLLLLSKTQAKA